MATIPAQKDTTFTKIFVGGLPYHTTDESLKTFFEQFGDIDEAVVITDRQSGKSRGYGFVTMATKAAAEMACKDPNPIIDGRKANVNLAYLGAKPRGIQGADALSLPYALKAGFPGLFPSQFGLPQYMLAPAAAYMTSPYSQLSSTQAQISPTAAAAAAGHLVDYTTAVSAYPGAATATGTGLSSLACYEAAAVAAQYATAAQFASAAGLHPYTYGVPQHLGLTPSAAAAAHYQPQQLQERMQ